jgi:hypothetical protein
MICLTLASASDDATVSNTSRVIRTRKQILRRFLPSVLHPKSDGVPHDGPNPRSGSQQLQSHAFDANAPARQGRQKRPMKSRQ